MLINLIFAADILQCSYYFVPSFFFFSSRRRHTRCGRDWSSDVCSSDLRYRLVKIQREVAPAAAPPFEGTRFQRVHTQHRRSEERRVGKECRSRWSPYH